MLHVNISMFDADINKLHVNKLIMLHVDIMILLEGGAQKYATIRWGRIEIFNCWIMDLKFDPKRHLWNIIGNSRGSYSCFCCTSSRTARIPCDVHKNDVNVSYTLLKKKSEIDTGQRSTTHDSIFCDWSNLHTLAPLSHQTPFQKNSGPCLNINIIIVLDHSNIKIH